ncbi:bacteriocin fulvocin C-related protein [Flavobacterium fluviatile]|uniref:bacteriocin fulvocin C-related protein n=1 Tax=Flavobacterium fluviatile TaxID=1862387 RepID=UPI0013D8AA12|nr:bacteriocin fulvocin C-related protein [Flavobacterium fluviatile]
MSCSQDVANEELAKDSRADYKIDKVFALEKEDVQRNAYTLLTQEEKYTLWIKKLESLIDNGSFYKSETISLNSKQKALIQELKNKVTKNVFADKPNDEKEYFLNIYAPKFLKKAQKVFTYDQMGLIFYKISKTQEDINLKKLSVTSKANSEGGCNCAAGGYFTCQWGGDKCAANTDCRDPRANCGFMWSSPCDGDCRVFS